MSGRYTPYNPFILKQKVRQIYYVSYPKICNNFHGWCHNKTPRLCRLDNVQDELLYQDDKMSNVISVTTILYVQDLAHTLVLELLNDVVIKPMFVAIVDELDESNKDEEHNDDKKIETSITLRINV